MTPHARIQQLRAHADVFALYGADDRARMLLNLADRSMTKRIQPYPPPCTSWRC